jgi:hypothetical protein
MNQKANSLDPDQTARNKGVSMEERVKFQYLCMKRGFLGSCYVVGFIKLKF